MPSLATTSLVKPRRVVAALFGVVGAAGFLSLAARHLDTVSLQQTWAAAILFPWLPLGVLSYLVGQLLRGQRLRLLVRREATLSLATASNVVIVGYAGNNVLPFRIGELVRVGMLSERTGIPAAQALTVILVERWLDGISILAIVGVTAFMIPVAPWVNHLMAVAGLVFGFATVFVGIGVFLPSTLMAVAVRTSARFGRAWHTRAVTTATAISNGAACLRNSRDALTVASLSMVIWISEAGLFVLLLPAFRIPLRLTSGLLAMGVTNLGLLAPSGAGFVGPFQHFASHALMDQSIVPSTALLYSVMVHLAFFAPVTLWGALALVWYGIEVGTRSAVVRAAASSMPVASTSAAPVQLVAKLDAKRSAGTTSAFFIALTEAIVPLAPQTTDRAAVILSVATFVSGEMSALPARLAFMFQAGMTGFRLFVWVSNLSGFGALPLEKRRAAVNSWAFGRIGLLRQLFRPVRSTALLAYFEHASVIAGLEVSAVGPHSGVRVISNG